MINRYQVSIGGQWLHTYLQNDRRFRGRIIVQDIRYAEPGIKYTIETPGDMDGGIVSRKYREKASVTVVFGIDVISRSDRHAALEAIQTLAGKGGDILTGDYPGRVLRNCVCEQLPAITSAKDWAGDLEMTFSSYAFPYWQDIALIEKNLQGTNTGTGSFTVPGNAPVAFPEIRMTALANFPDYNPAITRAMGTKDFSFSGPVTFNQTSTAEFTVSGTKLRLFYPFRAGDRCVVDTDEKGNGRIRIYNSAGTQIASGRDYMLPDSSDRLIITPGAANSFSIYTKARADVTLTTRGAWL